MRQCTHPGCERPYRCKGLCEIHYWRSRHGFPMDAPIRVVRPHESVRDKLLSRRWIDAETGCWVWLGAKDKHGYGSVSLGGGTYRAEKAYRASYREFVDPIPPGAHVLHRCDNPSCINPDHLFLGDQRANMADMVAKGRQQRGERGSMAKLTGAKVALIRAVAAVGVPYRQIAKMNDVHPSTISRIVSGKRWKHL